MAVVRTFAAALACASALVLSADGWSAQKSQEDAGANHVALAGRWRLSREGPAATPSVDVPGGRAGRRGGRPGIGGGSGFGGFGGGQRGGGRGAASGEEREEAQRLVALSQELFTPQLEWQIRVDPDETVVFTDAEGRSVRYAPNGKAERHQMMNGTIETKTRWSNGELSQEIMAGDAIRMARAFSVATASGQMMVKMTSSGGGRRGQSVTFVYDREED